MNFAKTCVAEICFYIAEGPYIGQRHTMLQHQPPAKLQLHSYHNLCHRKSIVMNL